MVRVAMTVLLRPAGAGTRASRLPPVPGRYTSTCPFRVTDRMRTVPSGGSIREGEVLRHRVVPMLAAAALVAAVPAVAAASQPPHERDKLSKIDHIVVIYEENHSFHNLYGGWEGVNRLADAPPARTVQVNQGGVPFTCLKQNDVNLSSPPL